MLIQYLPKELVYLTEDEEISIEGDDGTGGLNEEKLTDMSCATARFIALSSTTSIFASGAMNFSR